MGQRAPVRLGGNLFGTGASQRGIASVRQLSHGLTHVLVVGQGTQGGGRSGSKLG